VGHIDEFGVSIKILSNRSTTRRAITQIAHQQLDQPITMREWAYPFPYRNHSLRLKTETIGVCGSNRGGRASKPNPNHDSSGENVCYIDAALFGQIRNS
jgi:hypothetical protein